MLAKEVCGHFEELDPPTTITKLLQGTHLVCHHMSKRIFTYSSSSSSASSSSSDLSSELFNKLSISTKGSVQLLHLPAVHHLPNDHDHDDNDVDEDDIDDDDDDVVEEECGGGDDDYILCFHLLIERCASAVAL